MEHIAKHMVGQVCIVTGSNTGIGKETARGLAELGATVILACRSMEKGNIARHDIMTSTGNENVHVLRLDLADAGSIRSFINDVTRKFKRLDVLVNNAGIGTRTRTVTTDGLETTFAVNYLGMVQLTLGLLDLLRASAPARIVVIGSKLHKTAKLHLDDLQYEHRPFKFFGAYNESKLATMVFVTTLAKRLAHTCVTVNAVHPGVVATEISRDFGRVAVWLSRLFLLSPKQGAETPLYVATSPEGSFVSGKYFDNKKQDTYSPIADDVMMQERLWRITEDLIAKRNGPEQSRNVA